eukprot:287111-Chlamydomonas_euryale.AAC.3
MRLRIATRQRLSGLFGLAGPHLPIRSRRAAPRSSGNPRKSQPEADARILGCNDRGEGGIRRTCRGSAQRAA